MSAQISDASSQIKLPKELEPEEVTVWPDDLAGLQRVLTGLEAKLGAIQQYIQGLVDAENARAGIFYAQEIHKAKQIKMMLKYQRGLCEARVKSRSW